MITIVAKNFQLTQALKDVLHSKFEYFKKFDKNLSKVNIYLEVFKNIQKISVYLLINNKAIKAEAEDENLYLAIDEVIEKLKNHLEKVNKINKNVKRESIRYFNEEKENDEDELIVKRKIFDLKPMYEVEAIEQMNLLKHDYFIFFNPSTEQVEVLYKRKDKKYGSINFNKQPEEFLGQSEEVVKRKTFKIEPLLEKEAIDNMNKLGHNFFVFLNAETHTICMVYKRKEKGYGLIESLYNH